MLSIYLCDDDSIQLKNWANIVENHLLMKTVDVSLKYKTTSGNDLLTHLNAIPPEVGLYFLDINLNEQINGLALASQIKELDPLAYIVFITTHSEMCYMTFNYKIGALDFIIKDQSSELPKRIIECITAALNNLQNVKKKQTQYLTIKIENECIRFDVSQIIYIESSPTIHKVLIHTTTGIINIYHTLKSLESALDSQYFYRCNKSTIVNINYVVNLNHVEKRITLKEGTRIFISNHCLKNLKCRLKSYM